MARIKITKEELLKLVEDHTIQEIADMFKTSYTTVWKSLRNVGYKGKVGRPRMFSIDN